MVRVVYVHSAYGMYGLPQTLSPPPSHCSHIAPTPRTTPHDSTYSYMYILTRFAANAMTQIPDRLRASFIRFVALQDAVCCRILGRGWGIIEGRCL